MDTRFQITISDRRRERDSPVVLALDLQPFRREVTEKGDRKRFLERCIGLVEDLSPGLAGVKVGYPLLFSLGSEGVRELIERIKARHPDIPFIGDFKIADVASTNQAIARHLFHLGIDAVIFHLSVGYEKGFDSILREAEERGKGTIGVAYMSHPGAEAFYQKIYPRLVEDAVRHGVDGLVVPATQPSIIETVRGMVGDRLSLFAPGVGVQGGDPKQALERGADYIIVGRSIYRAKDPVEALARIRERIS